MIKIDSHQHFWKFDPVRDNWITNDMRVIQKDFLPPQLQTELRKAEIDGCIAVQANQSEEENDFLVSLAAENNFIKGIVGWVDLRAANVEDRLAFFAAKNKIKGFRHVLQGEEDRALMLKPHFANGIAKLKGFGFTYDILIFPDQLAFVPLFLKQHPDQKFVLDHLAKPSVISGDIDDWTKNIRLVAQHPNVWCKVSGLVTEAAWKGWQPQHLKPYLDAVWEAFGSNRVMFGSDWPVCLVAASYQRWVAVMKDYTSSLSDAEKTLFWGETTARFYNLSID